MSTTLNADDTRTDAIPVAKAEARQRIPRFIRKFAVPIILGWIGIIAVLNVVVPQLDEVGKMRSVSMAPDDAQSVVATKAHGRGVQRVQVQQLGDDRSRGSKAPWCRCHTYYDELVKKLDADTKHVEHVQDMWSDPLTGAGAQSNDGKAAYVQVYLAGNQANPWPTNRSRPCKASSKVCLHRRGEDLRHRAAALAADQQWPATAAYRSSR